MTTYLGKSCSFGLPRVPFVNCRQFMYLVISLLALRAGCGIWLYQFLIIAYLFILIFKNLFWHSNWVGKFYFDIQNNILTFELNWKMLFWYSKSILTYEQSRKMLFQYSKFYLDIRTQSENRILIFKILLWHSNLVDKSYFDIQNSIFTFELNRKIVFWHSKSDFDIRTE